LVGCWLVDFLGVEGLDRKNRGRGTVVRGRTGNGKNNDGDSGCARMTTWLCCARMTTLGGCARMTTWSDAPE
jgi:hypothetical protein